MTTGIPERGRGGNTERFMEYLGNILCITGGELIRSDKNPDGVISEACYKKLTVRKKINVVRRACYGSPALVEYDSLPARYREAWEARHGDPHARRKFAPFAERLHEDADAYNVFTAYTYDGERKLPDEAIVSYCNDAMILNAVRETLEVMTAARRSARLSMAGRWEKMLELVDGIRTDYPNNLPKTAITLKRKYQRYQAEGYTALIHAGFGNRNRVKVKDQVDQAVLLDILGHGNQLPATVAAKDSIRWRKKESPTAGWPHGCTVAAAPRTCRPTIAGVTTRGPRRWCSTACFSKRTSPGTVSAKRS